MKAQEFDLAIVGSGFAGSLLAMIARRLGRSVALIEKGRHPRFAIGESSTPLANLLLEELAARYDLPRLAPLAKWGSWQRAHPAIACGLKRGFTFYHHEWGQSFDNSRDAQLLVAASPHDGIADTHWYRPDFDHFLVREAQNLGVEYFDETALEARPWHGDEATLEGTRHGAQVAWRARFVVDASGPRGFLHRAFGLPEEPFAHLPPTQALYTHFTGVRRLDEMGFMSGEQPPYPIDDAAVHHVFDGGWIWVLRFNNGVTSAGVAARDDVARELNLAEGAPAWPRLLEKLPTVRAQFNAAKPCYDWVHTPRLAFRSGQAAGPNWALLPSAAGFVNPLLSTGFPLTLLGVARLARLLEDDWQSPRLALKLSVYATQTLEELAATERLIAALYANMHDFAVVSALALLYFAAASFSETARRLHRPELCGGFLMHDQPQFGPALRACCEQAMRATTPAQKDALMARIHATIAPFDVAGLGDANRRNWYPMDASDLRAAREKLGASDEAIEALLARCGFDAAPMTA